MRLEGCFEIDQPQSLVWQKITDHSLMAGCIPGCENIEQVNDKTYNATIAVSVGIIKARFDLTIEVTKEIEPNEVHSRTSGQEGKRASMVTSENLVRLVAIDPGNTRVDYISDVSVSGRLGKYGLGMMQKQTGKLAKEFVANFQTAIDPTAPSSPSISPQSTDLSVWQKFLAALGLNFGRSQNKVVTSSGTINEKLLSPKNVKEATQMLVAQEDRIPISGGATLVAMLNANLIEPAGLVSLKGIDGLSGITQNKNGSITIGAFSRHAETANSNLLAGSLSGIKNAASKIANPIVRNMGTMGGSIAFADPAADYAPALIAAEAEIEVISVRGNRRVKVQDFFVDWYKTVLQPGDMVKAIHVPKADPNAVGYHEKYARVEGDFATVSAHVILSMNGETCNYIRIAIGACGPVPVRLVEAEKLLAGKSLTKDLILQAGRMLSEACDPVDDVRGSASYRLKLIPQLLLTAVEKAQRQLAQRSPA